MFHDVNKIRKIRLSKGFKHSDMYGKYSEYLQTLRLDNLNYDWH